MAGAPPAGGLTRLLSRVATRLTTPLAYVGVLGGLQVALMWAVRSRYGSWLAALTTIAWLGLLLLIVFQPGRGRVKLAGACLLALLAAFVPTVSAILHRAQVGLTTEHDGLLQLESAVDRLLKGQPIYGVDWSQTPMAAYPWTLTQGGNPALHHLAYFPLTVLVGVPVRWLTDALGAGFDYRLVLLAFAAAGLVAILAFPSDLDRRLMLVCALYVSPLITLYLWPGRNDIEFLALIFITITLLARGRSLPAGAALGAAVALKPFAWPGVPFFLLVLYLRRRGGGRTLALLMSSLAVAIIPVATIAPFFLANPAAFWSDVVLYTSGGTAYAYPIGGLGFGGLLYSVGVIAHRTDAFPFAAFQLIAMAPVLYLGARALLMRPTVGRWMAGYASLLFTFTFFARFFNDNYAAVVITLFLCVRPLGDRLLVPLWDDAAGRLAA